GIRPHRISERSRLPFVNRMTGMSTVGGMLYLGSNSSFWPGVAARSNSSINTLSGTRNVNRPHITETPLHLVARSVCTLHQRRLQPLLGRLNFDDEVQGRLPLTIILRVGGYFLSLR